MVKDFEFHSMALLDSGANMNYTQESLIPSKHFEKSKEKITNATATKPQINHKLVDAYICNNECCFKNVFIAAKNLIPTSSLENFFS